MTREKLLQLLLIVAATEIFFRAQTQRTMNTWRLPISRSINLLSLAWRFRHVIGITVHEYPRTIAFSGISTV